MIIDEDALAHYGTPRHSGRYPWGSGGDESARNRGFLGMVAELKAKGLSDPEIARAMGFAKEDKDGNLLLKPDGTPVSMGTTQFRNRRTIALNEQKAARIIQAERLRESGMSYSAIAKEMKLPNESSVRALLAPGQKDKNAILHATKETIRDAVEKHGIVDIGAYVEKRMGVPRTKFDAAVTLLVEEGYLRSWVKNPQLGTNHLTTYKVLCKKGWTHTDARNHREEIEQITAYSSDGGREYNHLHYPEMISSKRVAVKWAEDGGGKADGMIYVRRGVKDVSLGNSNYAQVRVNVDDTHYLKGMAMYKDDLPPGIDMEFHTNKRRSDSISGNKLEAMKPLKKDADGNPDFMKSVRRQRGVLNVLNEEGDWDTWAKDLSSQMLSKQKPSLAKQQLDVYYDRKKSTFDEILSLTNPIVRKKLLDEFADSADEAAVNLKAAGLPRTAAHVILPMSKVKPTEIYAPRYKNGERVALIRHPHGGIFEIPDLVVNNKNPSARKLMGDSQDAVGIHHSVAEKLSGADFDGDTVLVIPNNRGQVKHAHTLEALKNFDHKHLYAPYDGMRTIDGGVYKNGKVVFEEGKKPNPSKMQHEMGNISNLITDMTIKGANHDQIARAIKHSMVVIDSEKHSLNWKQSEIDNGIRELKIQWQEQEDKRTGAATLISRAGARIDVPERKQLVKTDPRTGKKIFTYTDRTYVNKVTGKVEKAYQKSKKLAETDDARTLIGKPPTLMEEIYADHSNRLKALANQARKEAYHTKGRTYNSAANKTYQKEVASLKAKLDMAQTAAPLERQAQVIGNAMLRARIAADPNMSKETKKRLKSQILEQARTRVNSKKTKIVITPEEWKAIQDGAITNGMLSDILDHADIDVVKELATPRQPKLMTTSKTALAKNMLMNGYTQQEVAEHLGVSLTTLKTSLKGE